MFLSEKTRYPSSVQAVKLWPNPSMCPICPLISTHWPATSNFLRASPVSSRNVSIDIMNLSRADLPLLAFFSTVSSQLICNYQDENPPLNITVRRCRQSGVAFSGTVALKVRIGGSKSSGIIK